MSVVEAIGETEARARAHLLLAKALQIPELCSDVEAEGVEGLAVLRAEGGARARVPRRSHREGREQPRLQRERGEGEAGEEHGNLTIGDWERGHVER